jgi:hypothetical protein
MRGTPSLLPAALPIDLRKVRDLRYGENPHQPAALYQGFGSHPGFSVLQGKELSYTNLLDLDAAARIVSEFREPAAVVIKHTNPCGAATGAGAADAYIRARDADSLAAFGGIVGLNRPIDADTARAIVSTFIEAVTAPSVEEQALAILATKTNMRVVVPTSASGELEVRTILGAALVQERDFVARRRVPCGARRAAGRDEAAADGGGMERAAVCLADLRARQIEHRDLHRRREDARDRRRSDEPRRRGQRGVDEGEGSGRSRARQISGRVRCVLSVP